MQAVIIILGAANDVRGNLSASALARLDKGLEEYRRRPGSLLLPTGGFGGHFNSSPKPHADYARDYLLRHGVPENRILPGVESANTVEDASLSAEALDGMVLDEIVVVTSDYHGPRAEMLFSKALEGKSFTLSLADEEIPPAERTLRETHERRAIESLRAQGIKFR
jgi:uncharacterized SAM-binding protein YcdF (DUF218 family)